MAHLGGGAEEHANSRPRNSTTHNPTREPDDSLILRGKIDPKLSGENRPPELEERLISKWKKKNKVRDVDTTDTEPVPTGLRLTKRPRLTEEESVGLNLSDDVAVYDKPKTEEFLSDDVAVYDKPKTEESKAAYEALLSQQSGGQPLNVVTCGAADLPVSIGKLITDHQDNRGDVDGTTAAGNGNTDHEALDNDVGVAVESEPEDNEEEDEYGSFFDALHEFALDNVVAVELEENEEDAVHHEHDDDKEDDVGVQAAVEFKENEEMDDGSDYDEEDYDATVHDVKEDEDPDVRSAHIGGPNVEEIDAYWLQRQFSKQYDVDMSPQQSQKFAEQVLKLLGEGDVKQVETLMLFEARRVSHLLFLMYVLRHRVKIVWCTRLARAENKEKRRKIEQEMMTLGQSHTIILKQVRATRQTTAANEKQKKLEKIIK